MQFISDPPSNERRIGKTSRSRASLARDLSEKRSPALQTVSGWGSGNPSSPAKRRGLGPAGRLGSVSGFAGPEATGSLNHNERAVRYLRVSGGRLRSLHEHGAEIIASASAAFQAMLGTLLSSGRTVLRATA